jgi:DNA-binding transcriptional ArsR family regulator
MYITLALSIHVVVRDIDETLEALADPLRRRVIDLLRTGPKRSGELSKGIGMTGPAASRHLRTLRRAGIVEVALDQDDARIRLYRLRPERLQELSRWLQEVETFWSSQLSSFKEYAEHRARPQARSETDRAVARRRSRTRRGSGKEDG